MSVQVNTYIVWGIRFEQDAFYDMMKVKYGLEDTDEVYEHFIEDYTDSAHKGIKHKNQLCIIDDGMSGHYTVVGHVVAKSEEGQQFSKEIIEFELSSKIKKEVKQNLKELFRIEDKPKWMIVTHYR